MIEAEALGEDGSREAGRTRRELERLGVRKVIVIEPGSKRDTGRVRMWAAR